MTDIALRFDARQHQTLTPRMQYAVRLLQLSSLEYEQELNAVIERNPFLEIDEKAASPADSTEAGNLWADTSIMLAPEVAPQGTDSWMTESGGAGYGANDAGDSPMDNRTAEIGLRQHLRTQANLLVLSDRDRALVCTVIESLDDDGYLRADLAGIGALAELEPPADACEMNTALKLVQSFEPAGVGARNLRECLLLQRGEIDAARRDLCTRIVTDHLERLAHRDVDALARLLQCPTAQVQAACAALRRLDPHPGWRYGSAAVHFVKPDVLVRKRRGTWDARLNTAVVPRLLLNQAYAAMFQRHGQAKHAVLGEHLREAHWTLRNVEQRFSTILTVARAIVRRQSGYFEYGALAMKPLALKDIARELDMHESTVCRVTNNKYMATPAGVVEFKSFFSRPMPMAGGGAASPTAIRGLVQEIIADENQSHPLSDVDIAQRLARQGLGVARRTVTKYRQMLHIPPLEQRRRDAGCHANAMNQSPKIPPVHRAAARWNTP